MNRVSEAPAVELGGGLRLRGEAPADGEFLLRLFAETHGAALLLAPLDEEAMLALLRSQQALHESGLGHHRPQRRWIVERDGRSLGRLVLAEQERAHYLADVALLPEAQGQGVGRRLLLWLQAGAAAVGKPLTLKARRDGRALAFYRRLGFEPLGDSGGLLLELRWEAP